MFYSISGTLAEKQDDQAVIENNGIAYAIAIPRSTSRELPAKGESARLYTMMIVRENEISLVGFTRIEDRRLYETLLTVSGIGPKQGLRILSDMPAGEIRNAIVSEDETTLSKIKGIGPKTASRIILELKDKIRKIQISDTPMLTDNLEKKKMEILLAMRVLGYTDNEARKMIDSSFHASPEFKTKTVEEIIKAILSSTVR